MKILFIAIPKNGGTFIANKLLGNFASDATFVIDELNVKLEYAVENIDLIVERYDFIAGHIPLRNFGPHIRKFDYIVSSYRDPLERALSYYRYVNRKTQNPYGVSVGIRDSIKRFYRENVYTNIGTRNHQCGFIGNANTFEAARSSVESHGLIMLPVAKLEATLSSFCAAAGLSYGGEDVLNASTLRDNLVDLLDEELTRELLHWYDGDFSFCRYLDLKSLM